MVIIGFKFPARRYHATPWDAHVNEGRIEWPPSPWRIMRALLAVGYTKANWQLEPPPEVQSLLMKLAECEPAYALPAATTAHTRHYMPTRDKTTKVFDSFVRMASADARLLVRFGVSLTEPEHAALQELVQGLAYLGRAESWVDAEVLSEHNALETDPVQQWCVPGEQTDGRPIRLIAPVVSNEYDQWRAIATQAAFSEAMVHEQEKAKDKGKTVTSAQQKKIKARVEGRFPKNLLQALESDTNTWQSQGWPQPPGSRWIEYTIPNECLETPPLRLQPTLGTASCVEAVLLAIDGAGKQGTVRPVMQRMLPVMELLHRFAVFQSIKKLDLGPLPELTGRDGAGDVLRGHRHAHYLPLSLLREAQGHGTLDHVLVWTSDPHGFSAEAVRALSSIRWGYSKGISDLSINVAGAGSVRELRHQLQRHPHVNRRGLRPLECGRVWESVTPLVFSKYLHQRGKKTPENQVRDELARRGFAEPDSIEFWSSEAMVKRRLKGFIVRRQSGKPQPPSSNTWAATLRFHEPQAGPIAIGYGSHFGLGLFGAVE